MCVAFRPTSIAGIHGYPAPIQSQLFIVTATLTERRPGVVGQYSALIGIKLHPHLRHTMAHQFLLDNGNDLVGNSWATKTSNTTARYTKRTEGQLAEASEKLIY